jgi:hypothetical protein
MTTIRILTAILRHPLTGPTTVAIIEKLLWLARGRRKRWWQR